MLISHPNLVANNESGEHFPNFETSAPLPPISPKIEPKEFSKTAVKLSENPSYTDSSGKTKFIRFASENSKHIPTFDNKFESLISPRTVTTIQSDSTHTISKRDEKILKLMESWHVSQETAELMYIRNQKMNG